MRSHLWCNNVIPFQTFTSLLRINSAANFCQLCEIPGCEGMRAENTEEWSFKTAAFQRKITPTSYHGNYLNIKPKGNQATFLELALCKWPAFQALDLIYCLQNLSHSVLLWQIVKLHACVWLRAISKCVPEALHCAEPFFFLHFSKFTTSVCSVHKISVINNSIEDSPVPEGGCCRFHAYSE